MLILAYQFNPLDSEDLYMWEDVSFPTLLGAELMKPDAQYIARFVVQPQVVHDFAQVPGNSVELHRYHYWDDDSFTEASRERQPAQVIGTGAGRTINKSKVTFELKEYTSPSAGNSDPDAPGVLKITLDSIIKAQRLLYSLGDIEQWHDSIGSRTLLRDFKKWHDRVYINRLLESATQKASKTQGGYYNPMDLDDGDTTAVVGPPEIQTKRDLVRIIKDMQKRNVPQFASPSGPVYHVLCDPSFIAALRKDNEFREVARYPGSVPINALDYQRGAPMAPPLMPVPGNYHPQYMNNPNILSFQGVGYGQAAYMSEAFPTGSCWEGARFFSSNNLPTATVSLNYSSVSTDYPNALTGQQNRTGYLGIFMGQQVIGEGVWSQGPQVVLHEDTDFKRFIQVIWQYRAGWVTLNQDFVTVARTYED